MNTTFRPGSDNRRTATRGLVLACSVAALLQAQAQVVILSSVPLPGATGVSPTAPVSFTFSGVMNIVMTAALFTDSSTGTPCPATASWNPSWTVLTCTPAQPFPANTMIIWTVSGQSLAGEPLSSGFGWFTTGGSGGQTGSGTNRVTSFSIGKSHSYQQTSAAAPSLDPTAPYFFSAVTILASNRTANSVSLTAPTAAISYLTRNPTRAEMFYFFDSYLNLASFDGAYPAGNYRFDVQAATSNQLVTLNLSSGLLQPGAPQITNYAAAQTVNAAQPFRLGWNPFPGGTASDYIWVDIGGVFRETLI